MSKTMDYILRMQEQGIDVLHKKMPDEPQDEPQQNEKQIVDEQQDNLVES